MSWALGHYDRSGAHAPERFGCCDDQERVGIDCVAWNVIDQVRFEDDSLASDVDRKETEACGDELDMRILGMEKTVGTLLYRNILRECGRVNQPKLIRDPAVKRTVLQMLESAARGIARLDVVTKRLDARRSRRCWRNSKPRRSARYRT